MGSLSKRWSVFWTAIGTRRYSDARLRLAELRESGVALRNDAAEVKDVDAFEKWEREVIEWTNEVQGELKKISESDAVWFSVLDVVPAPRVPLPTWHVGRSGPYGPFAKAYREHDFRVARLGEMIRELWAKTR